ncbi:MAG: peptide chain release factor N(5)-glutamine methyltransferase [Chromatiales bacterium]|nr:peptide chain release factor N(5)-glutamine methyltransferase [Chromatiales bacterium]
MLRRVEAALGGSSDSPRLDAEVLVAHALGLDRTGLYRSGPEVVAPRLASHALRLARRRASGEPVAYVVGRRDFWSLTLETGPGTLVPRPETELLVERVLERVPRERAVAIADLGTGTGAVALAVATERPGARVVATDASRRALAVAARNLARTGIANVTLRLGDWCAALPPAVRFAVIAANPPYVAEDDWPTDVALAHEPREALAAGADGLRDLARIADTACRHLAADGLLALEHGHDQGVAVRALLTARGYACPRTHRDLAGLERVTEATWPHR